MTRTTIDRQAELHRAVRSLAYDRGRSLSRTVAELVAKALSPGIATGCLGHDSVTGLPLVRLGKPITTEMVRAAANEE
ncbi:MAG: toxin-antitoxin system, antitoxin component [Candidatus Dormibacteria bacterium]